MRFVSPDSQAWKLIQLEKETPFLNLSQETMTNLSVLSQWQVDFKLCICSEHILLQTHETSKVDIRNIFMSLIFDIRLDVQAEDPISLF